MKLVRCLGLAAVIFLLPVAARAHPHVWITAKSDLLYAPDGTVTGMRHAWTFDEMFAAYALQGLPHKTKGVYTREELASLAQTNVDSLKEYAYFTYAKAGMTGSQKKEKFGDPVDYYLDYTNGNLTLHFTLPFKTPVKTKHLQVEVFDPSFFIDFQMADKDPIHLMGAPAGCKFSFVRPSDGTTPQTMNDATFLAGNNANYGAMFANKITVECP